MKNKRDCATYLAFLLVGVLTACRSATLVPPETATPLPPKPTLTSAPTATTPPLETPTVLPPTKTPAPEISPLPEEVIPPPIYTITGTQFLQIQLDGTTQIITNELSDSEIWDAIRIGETIFIMQEDGIRHVNFPAGKIDMVVPFEQKGDYGNLNKASLSNGFFYSIVGLTDCGGTSPINRIGFYDLETGVSSVILENERNIGVLGLSTDQQSFYAIPWGCDPGIGEFWEISITQGNTINTLPTWDETSPNEYGYADAALSPNGRFIAFPSSYYKNESTLENHLSLYDVSDKTIRRFPLIPDSHLEEVLWSFDSQKVYSILNPGVQAGELPEAPSHGVWSFDIQTETFSMVANLETQTSQFLYLSEDGLWLLLLGYEFQTAGYTQTYSYIYIPTGEKIVMPFLQTRFGLIVR